MVPPPSDIDALTLGPAARLLYLEADPQGRIAYRLEKRQERLFHFGRPWAGQFLASLDQILTVAFFHPPAVRLRAVASLLPDPPLVLFFGERWGDMAQGDDERRHIADPLAELRKGQFPLTERNGHPCIELTFCMNVHFREIFAPEPLEWIRPGQINTLELFYEIPSGQFREANLLVQDRRSQRILLERPLAGFPLVWPPSPLLESKGDPYGRTAPTIEDVGDARVAYVRYRHTLRSRLRDAVAASEKNSTPRPSPESTLTLPDQEMIARAAEQTDEETRWAILDANLRANSPARTYQILSRFADLVAERTAPWPVDTLVSLLGSQPAALLAAIAQHWSVETVMTLAEQSAEKAYLIEWLRERELERLFALDLALTIDDASAARRWLGIPRQASPEEIRRTWRRLLGFLNGDFGRRNESALHRKKDEIAKRLHQARDLLLKE